MTPEDLREEINIEMESMETTVRELVSLRTDVAGRLPTLREKTAAAAFLSDLYGGIENILKRISYYHSISLPMGDSWHIELFRRFCDPPYGPLPALFDRSLASELSYFRKFRHVTRHGYSVRLDWDRMREGVETVEDIYSRFKQALFSYLETLQPV